MCALALIAALSLSVAGCGHVTPVIEEFSEPSFVGNERNSGVVQFTADGAEVTPRARDEYNHLISEHGSKTVPPITEDFGMTKMDNGNYKMTLEAVSRWKDLLIIRSRDRVDGAGGLFK